MKWWRKIDEQHGEKMQPSLWENRYYIKCKRTLFLKIQRLKWTSKIQSLTSELYSSQWEEERGEIKEHRKYGKPWAFRWEKLSKNPEGRMKGRCPQEGRRTLERSEDWEWREIPKHFQKKEREIFISNRNGTSVTLEQALQNRRDQEPDTEL